MTKDNNAETVDQFTRFVAAARKAECGGSEAEMRDTILRLMQAPPKGKGKAKSRPSGA